ncbi:MAG: hypothetical protein LBR74_05730 [Eubacterium sp.]|jgi:hypothetical protein|nr:hypothetical protein [Eubacterium sp.]
MKILNHKDKEFYAAHFQGNCHVYWMPFVAELSARKVTLPKDLTIVTVASVPEKNMLIKQLKHSDTPFINDAESSGIWKNTKKIGYIIKSLERVSTQYVLVLDAGDVLLSGDLTGIVKTFKEYGKKLIFGATKSNHPNMSIDMISDRDFRGEFKYINAGTCIGETGYALEFYRAAKDILDNGELDNPINSEQFIIRHTFKDRTTDVDFDYECSLFQTFGKAIQEIIDLENNVYRIV